MTEAPTSASSVTRVVAVIGSTATGKSDLGVALAMALGGEVVNADAMQLYRGMDIGTAKLTQDERKGVAHHELDVLEVSQDASVAGYQTRAREDLEAIAGRGRWPVVVGGSGLYVRALLDDMELAPTDPQVRARLEHEAAERGSAALHADLARVDAASAAQLAPTNTRRIVRALEVFELTGQPARATLPEPQYQVPTVQIGLRMDRADLDERIANRVERMWDAGLVDEVESLADRMGRTASRAVGYAQVLALLRGEIDEVEARERTVIATRRLARRQMGWFGRDSRVHWIDAGARDLLDQSLAAVAAAEGDTTPR
jgi:tRNA dimethylallyltransferase